MQIYRINTDELYSDYMSSVKNVPTRFLEKFRKFIISPKRRSFFLKDLVGEYECPLLLFMR